MKVTISISSTDLAKLREYMAKHMRDVKAQVSWLTPADILANRVLLYASSGSMPRSQTQEEQEQ